MKQRKNMPWLIMALMALIAVALMSALDPKTSLADDQKVASDNPLSGDDEAIKTGRTLFNTWCSQCHGVAADGIAPRFGKYSADLRRFNKGFYEFAGIVAEGIVDKQMPPWGDVFEGDEISEIGAYLETLAIDGAKWADDQ